MARVLLIRLSSLGDIVLASGLPAALAAKGHTVDFLVRLEFRELLGLIPGLASIYTPQELPEGSYDAVLDLHGSARSKRLRNRLRTRRWITYAKHSWQRRLLIRPWGRPVFWNAWCRDDHAHVSDWYAAAARRLVPELGFPQPALSLKTPLQEQGKLCLARLPGWKAEKTYAVLAPGARWATKRWPLASYVALAERLQRERDLQIVFLGDEQDRERIEVFPDRGAGAVWNLAGQTTLAESAAILAGAQIVVSNDSGPLHLGLALGSRAVAFFGPTVSAFGFAPVGHPRAVVLEKKMLCRPCSLHGSRACPLGHHACLRSISVEETLAAIACLLDTPGGNQ